MVSGAHQPSTPPILILASPVQKMKLTAMPNAAAAAICEAGPLPMLSASMGTHHALRWTEVSHR